MSGHKHGAAILIRQNADLVGPNGSRRSYYFFLVVSNERAKNGKTCRCRHHSKVVERLAGNLSQAVTGHQGRGFLLCRNDFGDPHHETAVKHHPQRGRSKGDYFSLEFGKGNHVKMRLELISRKNLNYSTDLLLRFSRSVRKTMKMHVGCLAAAAHETVTRYRRIDASGKETHHSTAAAGRKSAAPRDFFEVEVGMLAHELHVTG